MKIPREVIDSAIASQHHWGVPASISIAQWALESNWGRSFSGKNNPFGIKALPGQPFTSRRTWEVIKGKRIVMQQNFADFASIADAFDRHGKLLATGKPYAKMRGFSADKLAEALTGVYATDPQYGHKLKTIMQANNLYKYDGA